MTTSPTNPPTTIQGVAHWVRGRNPFYNPATTPHNLPPEGWVGVAEKGEFVAFVADKAKLTPAATQPPQ